LGILAEKCQAYAKALHHKEIEFQENPSLKIEELISINNNLQQHEAAMGILTYAQKNHYVELKVEWYEMLQRWDDAYDVYDKKEKEFLNENSVCDDSIKFLLGKMRCLKSLGQWKNLFDLCDESWKKYEDMDIKKKLASMSASVCFNLNKWEFFSEIVPLIEENSEGLFYRSILYIHEDKHELAQSFIDKTRKLLDLELRALIGESYNRAYDLIVRIQQLSEMEEIIDYKENSEKRESIKEIWNNRLKGCQKNIEHWENILLVRNIVLKPNEQIDALLKFSSLCRKNNKINLSEETLKKLVNKVDFDCRDIEHLIEIEPKVSFEYLKLLWTKGNKINKKGEKKLAFELLNKFVDEKKEFGNQLKSSCFLLLGKWQQIQLFSIPNFTFDLKTEKIQQILVNYEIATIKDKESYKAHHQFALMNSIIIHNHETKSQSKNNNELIIYLVSAVNAYFKSISLSPISSSIQQDILRLLTLWFKYGNEKEVESSLIDGFETVSIDTWLLGTVK
jgi:serine/threonine-protein kinase mTOR